MTAWVEPEPCTFSAWTLTAVPRAGVGGCFAPHIRDGAVQQSGIAFNRHLIENLASPAAAAGLGFETRVARDLFAQFCQWDGILGDRPPAAFQPRDRGK